MPQRSVSWPRGRGFTPRRHARSIETRSEDASNDDHRRSPAARRPARRADARSSQRRRRGPRLLLAFAPVVLAATPDRVALGLSAEALAAPHPGPVPLRGPRDAARHPALQGPARASTSPRATRTEASWVRHGPANGLPQEITIVETHTPTRPSSSRASRTTSARPACACSRPSTPSSPCGGSGSASSGSAGRTKRARKEVYCYFQIERIDSKERLRHIEHEIFSVLKCVFTAVEDFQDMLRTVRELAPRLREPARAGDEATSAARASWTGCSTDNYIFQGTVKYRVGARRPARPRPRERDRRLHRPEPAAGRVPRPDRGGRGRTSCPRPRTTASSTSTTATTHRPSTTWSRSTTSSIREWGAGRQAAGGHAARGPPGQGRLHPEGRRHPAAQGEAGLAPRQQRGRCPSRTRTARSARSSTASPSASCSTRTRAALKEIIDRIVYMTGDDEIAVPLAQGAGYVALSIAFSRLRYSYKVEEDLRQALADAFGPISFSTSDGPGRGQPAALLLRLRRGWSTRWTRGRPHGSPEALVTTWEDRAAAALEAAFGEREGRRLFEPLHPPGEPQRPLPRGDAARGGARGHPAPGEPGGPAGGAHPAAHARDGDAEAVLGDARWPSPRPCARCRTWA